MSKRRSDEPQLEDDIIRDVSEVIEVPPPPKGAKCLGGCGFQEPYGFVPEADCPVHDRPGVKAWMDKFVAPLDRP